MNRKLIEASAITATQPIAPFAAVSHPRPFPPMPRVAARAARRLAVSPPTYYALKQAAAARTAPRTRAEVLRGLATARATHAIDIDLHS